MLSLLAQVSRGLVTDQLGQIFQLWYLRAGSRIGLRGITASIVHLI